MNQAIKVGLFVAICLAVLGVLIFKVEDLRLFGSEGRQVVALFDSVAGLNDKAPVRVAGVRVGQVEGIGLEGRRARVTLLLEEPVDLKEGARATIANAGILGDKYVELIPGPSDAPPLAEGTVIEGETPVTFDEALQRFDSLGQSLQQITGDVSRQGDLGQTIRRLLANLEATSADVRALVAANRDQVDATVANFERFSEILARELPRLTDQVGGLLDQVDSVVAENRDEFRDSLENIRQVSENIQTSVENLNDITSQVRSGEGTLGKLFYDDEAHDSLVSTLGAVEGGVASLSDTLGRVRKLELQLGLEGTIYPDASSATGDDDGEGGAAFRLRLSSSNPRRFYRVGVVNTPQGKVSEETRIITTTLPDGSVETTTIVEETTENDFTFNAQVAYVLGDFELRAGLIESSGGAGVDWHLFDRRLVLSMEAFDFSRPDDLDPHLRFTTRFHLNPNIYLLGGYDDPLADEFESVFFGAGITWTDDDLKYLLGSIPSF